MLNQLLVLDEKSNKYHAETMRGTIKVSEATQ
jgi:hypothetical protein